MGEYIIGSKEFKTKSKIVEFVQSILYKYNQGEFLDKADFEFVYCLICEGHHDPDKKIGCGVAGIFVNTNDYNKRGFFLKRLDGTETDFSYVKCIYKKSKLHDLKSACRTSIREDIVTFREDFFCKNQDANGFVTCPFTHEKLTTDNYHVDHVPPNTFNKIFSDWLSTYNIKPRTIELTGYDDGEITKKFVDKEIEKSFIDFHKKHMDLRITSRLGNLSGSKLENR